MNLTRFLLLLWKNWLIIKKEKWQLFFELTLPLIFSILVIFVRVFGEIENNPNVTYTEFDIDNTSLAIEYKKYRSKSGPNGTLIYGIMYAPENEYLESIVSDAVSSLGMHHYMGLRTAKILAKVMKRSNFLAGVEFDEALAFITEFPKKLNFSLRFKPDLHFEDRITGRTWETDALFPERVGSGPREYQKNQGSYPYYVTEGFIPLQHAISMSFLKLSMNSSDSTQLPNIAMERYPIPEYDDDKFTVLIYFLIPTLIMFSFMYSAIRITRHITYEKENQLKEVLKIMGLPNWIYWTTWFVQAFVIWTLAILPVLIIYKIKFVRGIAVINYSSFSVIFLFMLAYIIASVCFCFMIAVFFSKENTAALFIAGVWISTFVPYLAFIDKQHELPAGLLISWSLIFNTALPIGFDTIHDYEVIKKGIQWHNIFDTNRPTDISLGMVIIMLLTDALIYLAICLYVEQIYPGKFGVPKKWYFPFTSQFWCPQDYMEESEESLEELLIGDENLFFLNEGKKYAGIKIKNLEKKFGDTRAVKRLTMDIYEDEITVLLGHNGAGKTVTISMLVGLLQPTSGTAIINGYDIRRDIRGARASMGICSQNNVLFNKLSVKNHIILFSRLKGLKGNAVQEEVDKYLKMIELENSANILAVKLSSGMKRKLCLCCAFCGGSKIVICDEIISDTDPASRRQLWKFLIAEKLGRTILLTTRNIHEADILGDRIAIMSRGELQCYDTPYFLKKKYGSGYRLICEKRADCNESKVTKLLSEYIPDIKPVSNVGTKLKYEIPSGMQKQFGEMLSDLENHAEALGLNGYGVGKASLEEVFLKFGVETEHGSAVAFKKYLRDVNLDFPNQRIRKSSFRNRFKAIFLKKILYSWRNKYFIVLWNISVIAMIFCTCKIIASECSPLPPLAISLTTYPTAFAILEVKPNVSKDSFESRLSEEYRSLIESYDKEKYKTYLTDGETFSNYILYTNPHENWVINLRSVAAATISPGKIIAYFNAQLFHSAPLSLNLIHNAMAKILINPDAEILVRNHPLPSYKKDYPEHQFQYLKKMIITNISFLMVVSSAIYALFPIRERLSGFKLVQFIYGVRVWTYWISHFIWDMVTFTFTVSVITITFACFKETGLSVFFNLKEVFGIFMLFGFAAIFGSYFMGNFFKNVTQGFAIILIINFFSGIFSVLVTFVVLDTGVANTAVNSALWILRIFPHFSLANALKNMFQISTLKAVCSDDEMAGNDCDFIRECCRSMKLLDWHEPGILPEIVYLTVVGLFCFSCIIMYDYNIYHHLLQKLVKFTSYS